MGLCRGSPLYKAEIYLLHLKVNKYFEGIWTVLILFTMICPFMSELPLFAISSASLFDVLKIDRKSVV